MTWTEQQRASLSKQRGTAASYIKDQDQRSKYMSEQGDVEAQHGGTAPDSEYERMQRNAEDTIATQGGKQEAHARSQVNPAYKDKLSTAKHSIMDAAGASMAGEDAKPKKEIKEVRTRKVHKGGYIHEHHHTHPDVHPMEEHVSPDQDAMVNHMIENMGSQNPGEAEADAGQSGMPGAEQAPAAAM